MIYQNTLSHIIKNQTDDVIVIIQDLLKFKAKRNQIDVHTMVTLLRWSLIKACAPIHLLFIGAQLLIDVVKLMIY